MKGRAVGEPGVSSAARAGPARTGGRGSTLAPNYKDDDEPHVDEGDGAMHGAPRSAPSTPTGDTSQGRVRRGRPRRSTGGGDRARAASTARTKGGAGRDGSRSPRRSTRDVSASPPPRVRDVYALETLSVGSPAGLANPTASCVHTSGPTPDEKQERERKDLSDYHLTKLQPHPTAAVANELRTPSPPQNVDVQPAPTAPSSSGITREADAEATRLMRVAEMLQTGGRTKEALAAVDAALRLRPNDLNAITKHGLCFQALGALHDAYNAYDSVIRVQPNHPLACRALGTLFQTHGMLPEAADAFRRSLSSEPDDAPTRERLAATLTDLGTRVKLVGAPGQAVGHYRDAAVVDSKYSPAFYNLGVVMSELGRHDEALECYARTLEVNPAHAEAHCNVGVIKKYRGDLVGAIDAYEMCLAVDPNHALGRGNLSIALGDKATELKATGDVELAIRTYERALTLDPNSAEATYNLGVAQAEIGELDRATIAYENTLRLRPHCAEAWNNLGVLHRERNNVERAMECYQRAIAINPSFAQPLNNLGVVYTMQGQARLALEALQRAVASAPTYAVAHNNLGVLLRDTGDIPEALEAYNECARQSPDHRNAEQNYLLGLNYVLPGERTEVCAAHADWGVRFVETFVAQNGGPLPPRRLRESDWRAGERGAKVLRSESIRSFGLVDSDTDDSNSETEDESVDDGAEAKGESNDADPHTNTHTNTDTNGADTLQKTVTKKGSARTKRRLVVGYVTPDMYAHSVSYFAAAPLSHHDPSRVKVIVYSATPRSDAQTQMLKDRVAAIDGTWRDVVNLSERQLADAVRADAVDVLVELTGHTANNRLGTMALKPAPVQVTWIGYPNSTGLPTIDYRVTDAVCDPVDTTQTFTEHLARLPGCFLSYTPSTEAGPVAPAPCLGSGYVTFGCFNTLAKVTPDVRNAWARIMRSVPNSRLLLKAKPFACQTIQRRFLSAMEQLGVESWRIDLFPLVGGTGAHLSMYGMVDIALDTFPYAGTTTTCESLWMGVPVLTAIGKCHAHNVGASLLNAVGGMEDFIAVDTDDYVERAVRLANDPARLATTRMGLRSKMAASDLCDGRTFMRGVETAYLKMWRRWCRSEVEREDGEEKARRRKEEKMAHTGGGKKKGSGSECSTDDQRSPTASR